MSPPLSTISARRAWLRRMRAQADAMSWSHTVMSFPEAQPVEPVTAAVGNALFTSTIGRSCLPA